MLRDGRVGFIDFGIVGSISPVTWAAVESLVQSAASNDFDLMARSLVTMGMTDQQVDIPVRILQVLTCTIKTGVRFIQRVLS